MEDRYLHQQIGHRSEPAIQFQLGADGAAALRNYPAGRDHDRRRVRELPARLLQFGLDLQQLRSAVPKVLLGILYPGHLENQPQADTRLWTPLRFAVVRARTVEADQHL